MTDVKSNNISNVNKTYYSLIIITYIFQHILACIFYSVNSVICCLVFCKFLETNMSQN